LWQFISLRYGTIPIVRATGGLADTIMPFDLKTHRGNGFSFADYKADTLLETIELALRTFADKEQWQPLVQNAMNSNFSWDNSARKYVELYKNALKRI
jgi:starch synthase